MVRSVLLVGATGLFGGLLARQLASRRDVQLIVAGRRETPLRALASELGAQTCVIDRTDIEDTHEALRRIKPFAVIDCSGPFQSYGAEPYGFASAVIGSGAHYLDIADGADFVAGISTLDGLAKAAGVVAWSGASTTPALSSAIATDLVAGLDKVSLIETTILPGNKTPRGLSVMRAILGQVGRGFTRHRGGRVEQAIGWSDTVLCTPQVGEKQLEPRRAALVNTPDVAMFAEHFGAETVVARAGLELGLFHHALRVGRYLVPWSGVASMEPLARPLLRLSNLFAGFGSDSGGMRVRVIGTQGGEVHERIWDMIIPDGHGPKTPVQPVVILLDQLLRGQGVPSARAALGAFSRATAEAQLAQIGAVCERRDTVVTPIFRKALDVAFDTMPTPVQALHETPHVAVFKGQATVVTATTFMGKLAAMFGGFPLNGGTVPAEVEVAAEGTSERWTRRMGRKAFRSTLRFDPAVGMTEAFGPLVFELALAVEDGTLRFPVSRGRAFGWLPIPRFLTPVSDASESVDADGRFCFDVRLTLPTGALIVHYNGYLEPQ